MSSAFSSSQQEYIYNTCQKSWNTCLRFPLSNFGLGITVVSVPQNMGGSTLEKGKGPFEWEQKCEEWNEILEKIQEKRCLFHWFVRSIVVTDHALFLGKISWLIGSTHKGTRKRSCKRTWQRNTSEKQTTSKNNTGVDKRQCFIRPSTEADQCWRNNNWTEGRYYRAL